MIIGIVSKPDHAKNHAAALEADGHTIHLLGSSPVDFPQDIEVMVLRHLSSSHGGLERARNHAKARRIPLVAENGLSGIRMAINAMNSKHIREFTMETPNIEVQKPMQVEVDEASAIADAVLSGKPNSFVKQLLSPYSKTPARFLYRCMNAFEGKAIPNQEKFADFFEKLNPNEDIQGPIFSAFFSAGFRVINLKPAERAVIREAFLNGDAGKGSFFPSPMLPIVDSLNGRTNAFLAFYMWLLAEDRPKRSSIVLYAYNELTGGKQADPRAFAKYRDAFGFEMTMARESKKPEGDTPIVESNEMSVFLKDKFHESGMTIGELADLLNVSFPTAWRWVARNSVPHPNTLAQLIELGFAQRPVESRPVESKPVESKPVVKDEVVEGKILKTVQDEILDISIRLEEAVNVTKRVDVLDKGLASANASITRFESLLRDLSQAKQVPTNDNTFFDERFKKAGQEYQNLKDWVSTIQNEQRHTQSMVSNLQSDVIKLAEQVMVLVEQVKNRPAVEGTNVESALRTLKALGATVTITLPA